MKRKTKQEEEHPEQWKAKMRKKSIIAEIIGEEE